MRRWTVLKTTTRAVIVVAALALGACGEGQDGAGAGSGAVRGMDPAGAASGGAQGLAPDPTGAPAEERPDPTDPDRVPGDPGGRTDPGDGDDGGEPAGPERCADRTCSTDPCNGYNCPCDLLAQDCALAGYRCFPAGTGLEGQCYPAGSRGPGESCIEPPVGEPESCGAGLICLAESEEAAAGTCVALCGQSSDCGDGEGCYALDLGDGQRTEWGACWARPVTPPPPPPPCDVLAQDCGAGQACVLRQVEANVCIAAGTGAEGDFCTSGADCAAGLQCAGLAGSTPDHHDFAIHDSYIARGGLCLRHCRAGDDASCGAGRACAHVSGLDGSPRPDAGVCFTAP
jgi:hypothetical protein